MDQKTKNTNNKRFVRYSEGAEMYSMSASKFMQLAKDKELSEQNLVESFLSAKCIEGCSEKNLKYYNATIQSMIDSIHRFYIS